MSDHQLLEPFGQTPAPRGQKSMQSRFEFAPYGVELIRVDQCSPITVMASDFAIWTWTEEQDSNLVKLEHIINLDYRWGSLMK
jgi:hypothetical protein